MIELQYEGAHKRAGLYDRYNSNEEIPIETGSILTNYDAYVPYVELVKTGSIKICTKDINKENYDSYFMGLLNIFRDGIEDEYVHRMFVHVVFDDSVEIRLSAMDLWFNIIFWYLPLAINEPITSEFLYFEEEAITRKSIKNYIDVKFIDRYRTRIDNKTLNNIIDDTLYRMSFVDEFSLYFLNTINNEDSIELMNVNPNFYNAVHADLSNIPIEHVKSVGMDYTNEAIKAIKSSDHCLSDSFRAGEGINPKQFKEFMVNIGSKPDGNGQVWPAIINSSFCNGGLQDLASLFMESNNGRNAQCIQKENVGDSGHFARILGLNNKGTMIHIDPEYSCNTKNFQKVYIRDAKILNLFKGRWFRFKPNGVEYKLSSDPATYNANLVGQTLLFRSTMTCASAARGEGVCYKCYGDLAYTNRDINIGKIAAEILCSILTQMLLSAKHLLESSVKALKWSHGFSDIFDVQFNIISIRDSIENTKKYNLIIDPEKIYSEDEIDNFDYNNYITSIEVETPEGVISIFTEDSDNIYLSSELLSVINKYGSENKIAIPFDEIKNMNLFLIQINNNELSRTLKSLEGMLNKIIEIDSRTRDQILQDFIETLIEGGINMDAIHAEIILSNQIRSVEDILEKPQWEYPEEPYRLLTLNHALTNHPSITVSMEYQKLPRVLYNPLSYRKKAPSTTDLFFMERPQELMDVVTVEESDIKSDKDELQYAFSFDVGSEDWKKFNPEEAAIMEAMGML